MEIGEQIIVGRLGQQPMHIADTTVSPQHITLKKTGPDIYQIEDQDSQRGTFVFGFRIKRKTLNSDTPFFLGSYKTTVNQLLQDVGNINLSQIWDGYDKEKRKWDRYTTIVNSIRMLTPIITMALAQLIGQDWTVSFIVLLAVMLVSIVAGEKVLAKKNLRMAELNTRMQSEYICPHCHHFLGFTPFQILKQHTYCPHCGVPLP